MVQSLTEMVRCAVNIKAGTNEECDAIGRGGQLRSDLRVGRCSALQRQQAHDHLQAVQQPVIGLLAQERLMFDQLVLLAKQNFIVGCYSRRAQMSVFCVTNQILRIRVRPERGLVNGPKQPIRRKMET